MNTKYQSEIYKDKDNKFHWKITNKLGDLIFKSVIAQNSEGLCKRQIDNVCTIHNAMQIFYYVDKTNKHSCRLEDGFGHVIAVSDGFEAQNYCQHKISSFYRSLQKDSQNTYSA
jgi:uncharacterized protein YegP (UPF0339 family)